MAEYSYYHDPHGAAPYAVTTSTSTYHDHTPAAPLGGVLPGAVLAPPHHPVYAAGPHDAMAIHSTTTETHVTPTPPHYYSSMFAHGRSHVNAEEVDYDVDAETEVETPRLHGSAHAVADSLSVHGAPSLTQHDLTPYEHKHQSGHEYVQEGGGLAHHEDRVYMTEPLLEASHDAVTYEHP